MTACGGWAGAAGALKLPPAWLAMCTTARRISSSVSEASPPLGGIAPLPLITVCTIAFRPCLMCSAHCFLSPIFGAFATPAWWHAAQVACTIASPVRAPGAAIGGPISSRATGWMRTLTDSGVSAFGSARWPLSTSCTSSRMPTIGTTKESTITKTSCWGS